MVDESLAPPTLGENVKPSQATEAEQQQPVAAAAAASDEPFDPPPVTAILVVNDMRRLNLARTMVNQWVMHQTYQNWELVIANSAGKAVTNREHGLIREFTVDQTAYPTLAHLRNFAIEQAEGDWIIPLDDDSYPHPHRLVIQMGHRNDGCANLLTQQCRVDWRNSIVCFHEEPNGIADTAIFPKHNLEGKLVQYDVAVPDPECLDHMIRTNFSGNISLLENSPSWFPGPMLTVKTLHDLSEVDREVFLGPYHDVSKYKGIRPDAMDDDMVKYLAATLRVYGLELGTDRVEGPASTETIIQ
jgi:glycosyltransferase involved in cell wall biosynthesis